MTILFAHRGFVNPSRNIKENTIASLEEAVNVGFEAIEFDIWFSNEELVIHHDDPQDNIDNLPTLSEYFSYGNKLKYWMDFKNMNESNIDRIILLLQKAIADKHIALERLYFAPFIANYDKAAIVLDKIRESFGGDANIVGMCPSQEKIEELVAFCARDNIAFVSIQHDLIDEELLNKLSGVTFFAWTVNDLMTISQLESIGIQHFATDNIIPGDLHSNLEEQSGSDPDCSPRTLLQDIKKGP